MVEYRGGDIFMNRGDDVEMTLTIYQTQDETEQYEIQADDIITFSLLEEGSVKPNATVLFTKQFTLTAYTSEDSTYYSAAMVLPGAQTLYLSGQEYYYVVRITHAATDDYGEYTETVCCGRLFLTM